MHIRPYTLFSTVHPALLMMYALGAPALSMFSRSPECLGITFFCALSVHYFYLGGKVTKDALKMTVPFLLLIAVLNMLTNRGGLTVLARIGTWNFTLESLCYGLANGVMLGSVLLWFRCFPALVPNDKFLYLAGRKFQGSALLLSMILKLFPETKYKIRCMKMADDTVGYQKDMPVKVRFRKGLQKLSGLLEWSMEDSIETADSMKARGYGSRKRTAYENYYFTGFDSWILVILLLLLGISAAAIIWQEPFFTYYPSLHWQTGCAAVRTVLNLCYIGFLLLPIWMEGLKRGGGSR